MSTGEVLLILIAVVAILLVALGMFQRPRHVDFELSGPSGLKISGYYICDGVRTNFTAVTPSSVGFDFRRNFEFYAAKNDPNADFIATLKSSFMGSSAMTNGANMGVKASYSAPFPGFSSGSMGSTKKKN